MPNEIYHRSEWGNPKAEGFGDVYFDAAATNKLYNHSDYYENSDGTDKILRDIPNKASIVLTPTAYSDGSLNTVIPPYAPSYIENILFVTSEWNNLLEGWSIDETNNKLVAEATWTGTGKRAQYQVTEIGVGQTVRVSFDTVITAGSFKIGKPVIDNNVISTSGSYSLTGVATNDFLTISNQTTDFAGEITNIRVEVIEEADFDFSRGSSATRVNEKGLIEDVQILSSNLVQNGDFEEIGSEISNDVNFDNPSNWSLTGQSTISNGKAHIVQNDALNTGITANTTITNKTYKITGVVSDYISGSVGFASLGSTSPRVAIPSENGAFTIYYTSTRSAPSAWNIQRISSPCDLKLDNVSVKEVGQNWTFGTGWSIEDGKAVSDGSQTGTSFLYQLYSFTSGKKYRITYDIEVISGSIFSRLAGGGSTVDGNTQTASGTYTDDLVASVNHTNISFGASNDFVGSIDNISVIEITDDTDIPRIDYTSGTGALLLEPQSTNLITYSEDLSQWDTGGTTPVVTAVNNALTGQTNAYTVEDNDASVYERIQINATTTAAAHTLTVFIKKKTSAVSSYSGIQMQSGNKYIIFDSYNGTYNTASGNDYTEISVDDYSSYWRLKVTSTTSSGSIRVALWGAISVDGTSISANATGSETFYGVQLEQGSYATSYIPTEGSTVTRSADVANNSGNADLFNDSEGVLYAEIFGLADDRHRQLTISNGSNSNTVAIMLKPGLNRIDGYVNSGGSTQALMFAPLDTNQFNKIAVKYKENDFALWLNGVEVATDTSGSTPTGLNELAFDKGNGGDDFYGNTKELAVFKEALTDAELESLTSWISFVEMATDLEYTLE